MEVSSWENHIQMGHLYHGYEIYLHQTRTNRFFYSYRLTEAGRYLAKELNGHQQVHRMETWGIDPQDMAKT